MESKTAQDLGLREGLAMLSDRDFARLFAGRLVSTFGSAMAPIAMAFAVLDLTASAAWVGRVLACQVAAQVLVQLFAGSLADRFPRQRVMVRADLLAAVSQTTIAALLILGAASPWYLAGLEAVNGIAFALFFPAAVGIVPQVVAREKLQPANALLSIAWGGANAVGAAFAGVLVATVGAGWAIAIDALTFVLSAALLAGIRPGPQARSQSASMLAELRDGWQEFTSHTWLWTIVVQFSLVVAALMGGMMVLGPVVAERELGGPTAWGTIAGAQAVGFLVGALIGLRLSVKRPMLVGSVMVFGFAIPLFLLAGPAPVWAIAAGAFVSGVGGEIFGVLWTTALHTHVKPEALSRVSAYDILGSIGLGPIGMAIAGPLAERIGTRATLLGAAGVVVIATLAVLCVRDVWRLGTTPRPRPEHLDLPPPTG